MEKYVYIANLRNALLKYQVYNLHVTAMSKMTLKISVKSIIVLLSQRKYTDIFVEIQVMNNSDLNKAVQCAEAIHVTCTIILLSKAHIPLCVFFRLRWLFTLKQMRCTPTQTDSTYMYIQLKSFIRIEYSLGHIQRLSFLFTSIIILVKTKN